MQGWMGEKDRSWYRQGSSTEGAPNIQGKKRHYTFIFYVFQEEWGRLGVTQGWMEIKDRSWYWLVNSEGATTYKGRIELYPASLYSWESGGECG